MSPVWDRSMSPGPDLSIRSSRVCSLWAERSDVLAPLGPLTLGYLGNLPGGYGSSPPAWGAALSQCPPACALAGWEELLQSLSHPVFRSSHPQLFSAVFRATLDEKGIE